MQVESAQLGNQPFVLPASFAQQRMWFLDRIEPNRAAYNVPSVSRLRGPLDAEALEHAFSAVVERHETLRTSFRLVDGVPHQVIAAPAPFALDLVDLSGVVDAEPRALGLAEELAAQPFDLESDQLIRATLIRLTDEDHVLAITLHHIVTDGWSGGVLGRELAAFYGAYLEGRDLEMPELPIQYADYAEWQQQWMLTGGLDAQLEYWRGELAGAPSRLELPTDKPRPAEQSFSGATIRRVLPPELLTRVKALGEDSGTTLFMTLLAAYATLLSRLSTSEDLVIATPVAGRNQVELEPMIGLLVNTLALRVDLSGEPSFRELLAGVKESVLEAFTNQDLPFERLVQELNPERDRSHAPVAQVMFVLQNAIESPTPFAGLDRERVQSDRGTAKFDLTLSAGEMPDGLRVAIEYCTDLFEASTIERMLDHFATLLESAVADPDAGVHELKMVTESERHQLLAEGHATEAREFPVALLHDLFEQRVAEDPRAPAVSFEGASVSYGDLNERANRLAHRLRALGVGPESLVALLLEPSVEMVQAVLGVLKAGGAYVPLDPEHPRERLGFMLGDTAASVIVSTEALVGQLPEHCADVVVLDADALANESPLNPVCLGAPDDLAYVIYTSGSTGQPKGVQVEHRQVARLLSATDAWFRFGSSDVWTLLHSYAFDFSVWELWGALAYGARLVLAPRSMTRTPAALAELVAAEGVTVLNATPSLFLAVQEGLLARAQRLALRTVVFGGEALQPSALRPWFERFGDAGARLVNMYGITETTVHVTYRPLSARDCDLAISPIGVPIPDLSLYVLDRAGEPVPLGVQGELFVGGAGLARGYLNRPELTDQRFLTNPFGGSRLYRTGDLVRRRSDGEVEYLGRVDQQVKIRGFRIELGEISSTVSSHTAVARAAVIATTGPDGDARLAAYVVPVELTRRPGADQLRAFVADRLPAYMVPAAWVFVDALPMTPNGKLDVKGLPKPEFGRAAAASELVVPRTDVERRLAGIWCELLGLSEVGVNDDFFELGGHSMLAVRMFSEIERRLGARLPISALFESATIAGLAALVERDRDLERVSRWKSIVPMRAGSAQTPLFLIAWAGGEVLPYRDLVEALPADLPVYGLSPPGTDRRTPPLESVEKLASYYVQELRGFQPDGPYRLGGFCFSGVVAYEMAAQLYEQGEDVEFLALFDAFPLRPWRRPGHLALEREKFKAFRRADAAGKWAWACNHATGLRRKVRHRLYTKAGPLLYEWLAARGLQHWMPSRPWNLVLVASNLAHLRYVPRPAPLHVSFFRAQKLAHDHPGPWDEVAEGGVDTHRIVSADLRHDSIMHEHVPLLAREVVEALRAATSRPRR